MSSLSPSVFWHWAPDDFGLLPSSKKVVARFFEEKEDREGMERKNLS